MENKMVYMNVKCDNCGYGWDYPGKSKWYLACPKCKNTININKLTEKDRNWGIIMTSTWFCRNCNNQLENPILGTNKDNIQCLYCGSKQIEKR